MNKIANQNGDLYDGSYPYETIDAIATHIRGLTKLIPRVGIICGSGMGFLGDELTDKCVFPYEDIPHFPVSTAPGHAGKLIIGNIDGVTVLCLQGRFHYYEGYPMGKCALPVRVMKLLGINNIIVSNAVGALNPKFRVGDLMVIKDHINIHNFGGVSPLRGVNDERFGPRFPPMNNAYNYHLREAAKKQSEKGHFKEVLREGIYSMASGPMFETPAELRFLQAFGIDAIGMSVIPEVIVARHCGMRVFAFSLVTNICITDTDAEEETHVDVETVGLIRRKEIIALVKMVTLEMDREENRSAEDIQIDQNLSLNGAN